MFNYLELKEKNDTFHILEDYCRTMPSLFTFCSVLSKTNVKITLFTSMLGVRQNNQIFVKNCFDTDYKNNFYCDVPDKMAASSK